MSTKTDPLKQYVFSHLVEHLYKAGSDKYPQLYDLVEDQIWQHVRSLDGLGSLIPLWELERAIAAAEQQGVTTLPRLIDYSLHHAGQLGALWVLNPDAVELVALLVSPDTAVSMVNRLTPAGTFHDFKWGESMSRVAKVLIEQGNLRSALDLILQLDPGHQYSALETLTKQLGQTGDQELILSYAAKVSDPLLRDHLLITAVRELVYNERTEEALSLLCATLQDNQSLAEALEDIASALFVLFEEPAQLDKGARTVLVFEKPPKLEEYARSVLDMAENLENTAARAEVLANVACALIVGGEREWGERVAADALRLAKMQQEPKLELPMFFEFTEFEVQHRLCMTSIVEGEEAVKAKIRSLLESWLHKALEMNDPPRRLQLLRKIADTGGLTEKKWLEVLGLQLDAIESIQDPRIRELELGSAFRIWSFPWDFPQDSSVLPTACTFLERMSRLFRPIYDSEIKSEVMRSLAEAWAHCGDLPRALEVITDIPEERDRRFAVWSIVRSMAARQELEKALDLVNRVQPEIRAQALAALVEELVEEGNVSAAAELILQIEDIQERVKALIALGDLAAAAELASQIEDIQERVNALAALGLSYFRAGAREEATNILNEIIGLRPPSQKSRAEIESLVAVVCCLQQVGGEPNIVRALLDSALQHCRQFPSGYARVRGFLDVARTLGEAGFHELVMEAQELALAAVKEANISPHLQAQLLLELGVDLQAYGREVRAAEALNLAVEATEQIQAEDIRDNILEEMVKTLARLDRLDAATHLSERFTDPQRRINALYHISSIGMGLESVDEGIVLEHTLATMTKAFEQGMSPISFASSLSETWKEQGVLGEFDPKSQILALERIQEVLAAIDERMTEDEDEGRDDILAGIVGQLATLRQLDYAQEVRARIQSTKYRLWALIYMFGGMLLAGQIDAIADMDQEFVETLEQTLTPEILEKDPQFAFDILVWISMLFFADPRVDGRDMLVGVHELIPRLEERVPRTSAYETLAQLYHVINDPMMEAAMLREAWLEANTIVAPEVRQRHLGEIARAFAELGFIPEALDILQEIYEWGSRSSVLRAMAEYLDELAGSAPEECLRHVHQIFRAARSLRADEAWEFVGYFCPVLYQLGGNDVIQELAERLLIRV